MWQFLLRSSAELGPRRAEMKFTSTRLALWVAGLLYVVASLFAQSPYRSPSVVQYTAENPVTETKVGDLERRIALIESNKVNDRMTRIEAIMEQSAKTSESNGAWLRAFLIPLALLCMEAMFRLATALPLKKKS